LFFWWPSKDFILILLPDKLLLAHQRQAGSKAHYKWL